ncbi:MAG: tRNA (adenine(22)-N(1))-methyltransferase TrmK [Porticoccaceae bacterium]|nr:tRNA (adenine(22)-N(1))-methyltransferase TrmK [Porticoccaceae bacterium]
MLKSKLRLNALNMMLMQRYSLIWDCCCDHGLLGMSLLQKHQAEKVIFVDILAHQMDTLETKLARYFPLNQFDWEVRCQDIKAIIVPDVAPQLFIIAGVGAFQTIEFIKSLYASAQGLEFDLLVCTVHGSHAVRQVLINLGFKLKSERIIVENNRFYEGLYVSTAGDERIVSTGNTMWNWSDPLHQQYLEKMITHYRKKATTDPDQFQLVLAQYKLLKQNNTGY